MGYPCATAAGAGFPTRKDYRYKAFISYSNQDKKRWDRLRRALETCRMPKALFPYDESKTIDSNRRVDSNNPYP